MNFQQQNEATLLNLWHLGEKMWEHQLTSVTRMVEDVEKRVWLGPCQLETGYEFPCHRTATVTHLETGCRMCLRCYQEIEYA